MTVDEALLIADEVQTGFSGHIKALKVLAAEVRRQHAEIKEFQETIIQTIAHIEVARAIMRTPE